MPNVTRANCLPWPRLVLLVGITIQCACGRTDSDGSIAGWVPLCTSGAGDLLAATDGDLPLAYAAAGEDSQLIVCGDLGDNGEIVLTDGLDRPLLLSEFNLLSFAAGAPSIVFTSDSTETYWLVESQDRKTLEIRRLVALALPSAAFGRLGSRRMIYNAALFEKGRFVLVPWARLVATCQGASCQLSREECTLELPQLFTAERVIRIASTGSMDRWELHELFAAALAGNHTAAIALQETPGDLAEELSASLEEIRGPCPLAP